MGNLGIQEMIIIFVIALIVFGPKKMPEIGKSLGKGIAEFKKASSDLMRTWEEEASVEKKPVETAVGQTGAKAEVSTSADVSMNAEVSANADASTKAEVSTSADVSTKS